MKQTYNKPNPYTVTMEARAYSLQLVEGTRQTYLYMKDAAGNVKDVQRFPNRSAAEAVFYAYKG